MKTKNTKYILAITVVIAGLLMTSAIGISADVADQPTLVREIKNVTVEEPP